MNRKPFWMGLFCGIVAVMMAIGGLSGVTPAAAQGPATPAAGGGLAPIIREFAKAIIDATTKATGMSETEVLQAVFSGKTLTQIITDKGKDPEAVKADAKATLNKAIDEAVAAKKLTQVQATRLRNLIDPALNRAFLGGRNDGQGALGQLLAGLDVMRTAVDVVSSATKLSSADILKTLTAGKKSLQDILTDNKADVNAAKAQIKTQVTADIAAAVTANKLTQAQADALTSTLDTTINTVLTRTLDPVAIKNRVAVRMMESRAAGMLIDETSRQTNLTQREILAKLRSGKTLSEIVTDAKGTPQKVVDAALSALTEEINQLVARKRLTSDEGDLIINQLPATLANIMTQKNPLSSSAGGGN